jgi:hypothetical protein
MIDRYFDTVVYYFMGGAEEDTEKYQPLTACIWLKWHVRTKAGLKVKRSGRYCLLGHTVVRWLMMVSYLIVYKLKNSTYMYIYIYILSRIPRLCGSVTNNSTTRVRIGYRIYSLRRFTAAHITITENILTPAPVASRVPLTELYCADVSLRGLISSDSGD